MSHAQFVSVPPIEEVHTFFTAATGCMCTVDASWSKWLPLDPDDIFVFLPYVRQCHQKLLMETADGSRDPCAFMRQLLRPHGLLIEFYRNKWTLIENKEAVKTVMKKEGRIVSWSG